VYHIGALNSEEKPDQKCLGFFTTYDGRRRQTLAGHEAVLTAEELRDYVGEEEFDHELRLNPNFKGRESYQRTFQNIQKAFASDELQKAVLFNTVHMEKSGFPSKSRFFACLRQLLDNQKSGYLYGFYNPSQEQAYLGLTPEFLCRQSGQEKYTTAVAGTKFGPEMDTEWDDKLQEEHALVKKGIDHVYEVSWSEDSVLQYGTLKHLKSEGVLLTKDELEVISNNLHPTAAVGTLPRAKSLSYTLGDLSSKERSHFGGYAVLSSVESPFSLVTIRGIEWSNEDSFVCVGGGVLPNSKFEDEWKELEKKWETFKGLWQK